jgi:2'-5' RNA ligase
MCRAQVEIHTLLEHQYGLKVAGKFMPHATIKGFFKTGASVEELIARLDPVMHDRPAFEVHNGGPIAFSDVAIVLTIQRLADGSRNEALQALHTAALDALLPIVAPDCRFSNGEWRYERFEAHLTLAMRDLQEPFIGEVLELLRELGPIGPGSFLADTFHLYRFTSDDWDGTWWETMRWELLHGWRLPRPD